MEQLNLVHAPFNKAVWKNRRVLILGLGQYPQGSGVTAALLFARLGARVTVTDLKTAKDLKNNVARLKKFKNVRFVLGRHDLKDVRDAEFIVPNQRVRQSSPEILLAKKLGKPIQTEMALFLNRCPAMTIAVTGTRGKSTTTSLIAHLLHAGADPSTPVRSAQSGLRSARSLKSHGRVWLGGNILISPLTFLSSIKPHDIAVLELSSFQTESLAGVKPVDIAVITNLMRDHLNAYANMEEYAEAKAQIFRHQTPKQTVILNADDDYGRVWMKEAPSRVATFSLKDAKRVPPMQLIGEHNRLNAAAAILVAKTVGMSAGAIKKGLKSFKPLPNRLETIRDWHGIRFVNDTTATTPDGTIAAIEALSKAHRHLWMIVGGADKELEYQAFAQCLKKHHPHVHLIMLPGDASLKMYKEVLLMKAHIHPVHDLQEAVETALHFAMKGDVIALSPGAASFNQFANEFERGEVFVKIVKGLGR